MKRLLLGSGLLATLFLLISPFLIRKTPHQIEEGLRRSGARQSLDLLTAARAYPGSRLPDAGFSAAFDLSKRSLRKSGVAAQREPWRAIGPHNIGGRTLAIALNPLNPNTVYAGSASGGLWRSYTGGRGANSWENLHTGFPVLGVSAVAIASDDSSTIYLGTGEVYGSLETFPGIVGDRTTRGSYGIGILKTTDAGRTWVKSLDWAFNQRRGVQKIRINPLRSATVWAAITEGTFKSYDAGESWQLVHDVVMATDLAINPIDTSIVFVACGGMGSLGHGVYRTTDGGDSWTKMNLLGQSFSFNGKALLSMSRSSPAIVYVSVGKSNGALFTGENTATWLFRTDDNGDTWNLVSTVDYARIQGWYSHNVAVHPGNPDVVWAAGQPFSPYYSTDGGANLASATSLGLFSADAETQSLGLAGSWADYHEIVFHPTNPEIIYFANDGGVFRTLDGGRTVANCSRGYQTTQFYNGTSNSQTDSLFMLGGLQDNNSVAYDGSLDWRRLYGGDGSWTAMNQSNNDTVYLSLQFLNMVRSSARGVGELVNVSPPRNILVTNFIAPFILSPADNRTLYAGSNLVHKSVTGGSEWFDTNGGFPLDGNPLIALAGSFQSANVIYAATSPNFSRAHVFRTEDGGDSWDNISADLPDRFPTDLAVNPNDGRNVFVTFGGFNTSHVFRSNDGGESWTDIGQGLPDVPTWSVTVDPGFPEQVFVGNDLGVYLSQDGGENWEAFMNGLPDAVIAMDLTLSTSNRALRVATHGNGVYETPLPEPQPESLVPETITLLQNYPNPFNAETTIEYFLEEASPVQLRIYNSLGQEVKRLVEARQNRGWYREAWDGTNGDLQAVSSGVYLYRLVVGSRQLSRTMTVLK